MFVVWTVDMPDMQTATTPRATKSRVPDDLGMSTSSRIEQIASEAPPRRVKWRPCFERDLRSLPTDWVCPICNLPLAGGRSCYVCGLPVMHDKNGTLDGPQHVAHTRNSKNWRKFAKGRH
jgi:hypothetical protein